MAICKGTVLARFFIGYLFRQPGFSLARFLNFSPWRDVVFAKGICGCAANLRNSNMFVVFSVLDLCDIMLVIFLYMCVLRVISVPYAPLSIKPLTAPLSKNPETYFFFRMLV
jgi:hypothetical protein